MNGPPVNYILQLLCLKAKAFLLAEPKGQLQLDMCVCLLPHWLVTVLMTGVTSALFSPAFSMEGREKAQVR